MEPALTNVRYVRELLARHGFVFRKSLGQNFLINPSVCPRMAEEAVPLPAPDERCGVLEIGAGVGVLTRELARRASRVVCVEVDERLRPVLRETLGDYENIRIVYDDAMTADLNALIRQELSGMRVTVAANLPYYITSPLIMRLLESRLPVETITVMVQKEAAVRLCTPPGERACGAVSAAVWYYTEPEMLFPVSRGSFLPAPDVDSCVIRLRVRREAPVVLRDEAFFFRMVRSAFAQRRKTLQNALSAGLELPKAEVARSLEEAGISPGARAEALTLDELAAAANALFGCAASAEKENA